MSSRYEVWYNADTGSYDTWKFEDNGGDTPRKSKIANHEHEAAAIGNLNRIQKTPSRLIYSVTLDKE